MVTRRPPSDLHIEPWRCLRIVRFGSGRHPGAQARHRRPHRPITRVVAASDASGEDGVPRRSFGSGRYPMNARRTRLIATGLLLAALALTAGCAKKKAPEPAAPPPAPTETAAAPAPTPAPPVETPPSPPSVTDAELSP